MIKKILLFSFLSLLFCACNNSNDDNYVIHDGQLSINNYNFVPSVCEFYSDWILYIEGYKSNYNRIQYIYFDLGMGEKYKVGDNLALLPHFCVTYAEKISEGASGIVRAGYFYRYVSGDAIVLEKMTNDYGHIDLLKVKFNNLTLSKSELDSENSQLCYPLNDDGVFTIHHINEEKIYQLNIPKQLTINGVISFQIN